MFYKESLLKSEFLQENVGMDCVPTCNTFLSKKKAIFDFLVFRQV